MHHPEISTWKQFTWFPTLVLAFSDAQCNDVVVTISRCPLHCVLRGLCNAGKPHCKAVLVAPMHMRRWETVARSHCIVASMIPGNGAHREGSGGRGKIGGEGEPRLQRNSTDEE